MIMNGRGLSPPPPFGLRSLYTHTSYHLTWHTAPMMHRSRKLATMSSYSGCPLRLFPNGPFTIHGEPSRIRLCRTVPRMLAYLATTWRSRQYLLLTIPESKNASTVMYATSITISGSKNAKIQPSEATWQNSPTRKCARPSCTLCPRRLAEASPHDKLWALARPRATPRAQTPRQSCLPLGHDLLQKDCEHIVPRGNMATLSQKDEIRLVLGHIDERRLAEACPIITCGASA